MVIMGIYKKKKPRILAISGSSMSGHNKKKYNILVKKMNFTFPDN